MIGTLILHFVTRWHGKRHHRVASGLQQPFALAGHLGNFLFFCIPPIGKKCMHAKTRGQFDVRTGFYIEVAEFKKDPILD